MSVTLHRLWPRSSGRDALVIRALISPFRACGLIGITLAVILDILLATRLGLSIVVMVVIALCATFVFLSLAIVTKILADQERLVYYHQMITILLVVTGGLWLANQPVLSFLDITVLGLAVILACGRLGCLMAGCCYGKPHRWGIRYQPIHALRGFPRYLIDIPLVPVQLLESVWAVLMVVVGIAIIVTSDHAGNVLVWYFVAYGLGRFYLEFLRGDIVRPYRWGISEAQFISAVLVGMVVALGEAGALPQQMWHALVLASLLSTMLAVVIARQFGRSTRFLLLQPRHIKEIAEIFRSTNSHDGLLLQRTSFGIQITASRVVDGSSAINVYSFSGPHISLATQAQRTLIDLALVLIQPPARHSVVQGKCGVVHLLVEDVNPQEQSGLSRHCNRRPSLDKRDCGSR